MRLKLTHLGASSTVTIDDASTLHDVLAAAEAAFKLPRGSSLQLFTGFPPREVVAERSAAAASAGIKSGSVVDVRFDEEVVVAEGSKTQSGNTGAGRAVPSTSAASGSSSFPPGPSSTWACGACTLVNPTSATSCDVCGASPPAVMTRHVVPADNSCLFTAIGYLTSSDRRMDLGPTTRSRVADYIEQHPVDFDEATLGRPPAAYSSYIRQRHIWGGGPELRAAAELLGVEVAAVSIQTCKLSVFGEEKGFPRRIYVLYDGIHFDAVHRPPGGPAAGSAPPQTVFNVGDADAQAGALAVAEDARRRRAFTDLAGCTLMCGVCGVGLTGEKQAREHAAQTRHVNFQEAADPLSSKGLSTAA